MTAWQRWMDEFDPHIPPIPINLGSFRCDGTPREEITDERLLGLLSQSVWDSIEFAAIAAHKGEHALASRYRAAAGYAGCDDWPSDNDHED